MKFCNPLLQYADKKSHQELSAETCNQELLAEKSHQESKKSTDGMLGIFELQKAEKLKIFACDK